jgi:putative membrane protein
MNWLNVTVSVGLALFATTFALANTMPVHLSFLGFSTDEAPLFIPIFIASIFGFAGGILALSFSRRKHKIEIKHLRKESALLHEEVENLRNIPLQDDL